MGIVWCLRDISVSFVMLLSAVVLRFAHFLSLKHTSSSRQLQPILNWGLGYTLKDVSLSYYSRVRRMQ